MARYLVVDRDTLEIRNVILWDGRIDLALPPAQALIAEDSPEARLYAFPAPAPSLDSEAEIGAVALDIADELNVTPEDSKVIVKGLVGLWNKLTGRV